jgi:hypothetical protein
MPVPTPGPGGALPKLVISLRPDGSVEALGPLGDKMLCYALLEMARDAIRDHCKAAESPIIKPDLPGAPK